MRTGWRALLFPAVYAAIRFGCGHWLDDLGAYAGETFDAVFCVLVFAFWSFRPRLSFSLDRSAVRQALLSFAAGVCVYRLATPLGLIIPFDLTSRETILFLLLIGPILEEMLFRQALWLPFEGAARGGAGNTGRGAPIWPVAGTALMFSAGHFYAYFFVPPELHSFVVYQTAYVLLLGVWWGAAYSRRRSVGFTLLLHFFFNLGFFAGFHGPSAL